MTIVEFLPALTSFFGFVLSALPLYFSVKLLGGKTTLAKTALVVFVTGVVVATIQIRLQILGGFLAFLVLLYIYRELFRLDWLRSLLAWMLQGLIIVLFSLAMHLLINAF